MNNWEFVCEDCARHRRCKLEELKKVIDESDNYGVDSQTEEVIINTINEACVNGA